MYRVRFGTPLVLNAFAYSSRVRARLPVAFWFPLVPIAADGAKGAVSSWRSYGAPISGKR